MDSNWRDDYNQLLENKHSLFQSIDNNPITIIENSFTCYSITKILLNFSYFKSIRVIENSSFALQIVEKNLNNDDKRLTIVDLNSYLWNESDVGTYDITVISTTFQNDLISNIAIDDISENCSFGKLIIVKNYDHDDDFSLKQSVTLNFKPFKPNNKSYLDSSLSDYFSPICKLLDSMLSKNYQQSKTILVMLPSLKDRCRITDQLSYNFNALVIKDEKSLLNLNSKVLNNKSNVIFFENNENLINSLNYLNYFELFKIDGGIIQSCLGCNSKLLSKKIIKSLASKSGNDCFLMNEDKLDRMPFNNPLYSNQIFPLLLILFKKYENNQSRLLLNVDFIRLSKLNVFKSSLIQMESSNFIKFNGSTQFSYQLQNHIIWSANQTPIKFNFFDKKWINLFVSLDYSLKNHLYSPVPFYVLSIISILKSLNQLNFTVRSLLFELNVYYSSHFKSIESDFITLINFFNYFTSFKTNNQVQLKSNLLNNPFSKKTLEFFNHSGNGNLLLRVIKNFNQLSVLLTGQSKPDDQNLAKEIVNCLQNGFYLNLGMISKIETIVQDDKNQLVEFKRDENSPFLTTTNDSIPSFAFKIPKHLLNYYQIGQMYCFFDNFDEIDLNNYNVFFGFAIKKDELLSNYGHYYH